MFDRILNAPITGNLEQVPRIFKLHQIIKGEGDKNKKHARVNVLIPFYKIFGEAEFKPIKLQSYLDNIRIIVIHKD